MRDRTKGIIILWITILLGLLETSYFGNNWVPKTLFELICDVILLIVGVTGIYFYYSSNENEKGRS